MTFGKWLSTIMLACIRIRQNPMMDKFNLLFFGYSVQVIGCGYFPRSFANDNERTS